MATYTIRGLGLAGFAPDEQTPMCARLRLASGERDQACSVQLTRGAVKCSATFDLIFRPCFNQSHVSGHLGCLGRM